MLIQGIYPPKIKYDRKLRAIAEQLRDKQTQTEVLLWKQFKGKRLGYKFRRQHPLHGFIVDFYCYELMLVVEIDGPVHEAQKDKDLLRDLALKKQGYRILRFSNLDVINNLSAVLNIIISKPPLS